MQLEEEGLEALFRGQEERTGVKSNSADLIGGPVRGAVSQRNKRSGCGLGKEARDTGAFASLWSGMAVSR